MGEVATILGIDPLDAGQSGEGSIEMWLAPSSASGGSFLSLYNSEKRTVWGMRQSEQDLDIEVQDTHDRHFAIEGVFARSLREHKPAFITVTSGPRGTSVYVDGVLSNRSARFLFSRDAFDGRLIVADSPWESDSFQGTIRGLAIYGAELSAAAAKRHFESWTQRGRPDAAPEDRNVALYLLDEAGGDLVHNRAAPRGDLRIPRVYSVVDKYFLEPLWKEFDFSGNYWSGIVKNVVGFFPVGFFFYPFLVSLPIRRAASLTVVCGALLSVMIELFQALLPTRDSGTTDILTNTLGTWIGVVLYRDALPLLVTRFSWLSSIPRGVPKTPKNS